MTRSLTIRQLQYPWFLAACGGGGGGMWCCWFCAHRQRVAMNASGAGQPDNPRIIALKIIHIYSLSLFRF